MIKSIENLIWIDLEMTGLNPDKDRIIEIATIVTDSQLNILAEGPVLAINQPNELLSSMDEWNKTTHSSSGLLERVTQSNVTEQEAELKTIAFLERWVPAGISPICGNTIGQDRRFLWRYMPQLEAYFHYRYLDVSTIKELAKRWKPTILENTTKESRHLALEDIRDSIEELKYYRTHFINLT